MMRSLNLWFTFFSLISFVPYTTFLIISNETVYRVLGQLHPESGNFSYFFFFSRRKGKVMFPLFFTTKVSSVLSEVLQAIQFCKIDKCYFQKYRLSQLHAFLCIVDTGLKTNNTKISYAISILRSLCDGLQTEDIISNNGNSVCGYESVSLW